MRTSETAWILATDKFSGLLTLSSEERPNKLVAFTVAKKRNNATFLIQSYNYLPSIMSIQLNCEKILSRYSNFL